MRSALRCAGLGAVVTVAVGLGASSAASASGPCGVDTTPGTACPLTASPITVTGTLSSDAEDDYYVFYATQRTVLSLTVNDPEDPACGNNGTCADVTVTLQYRNGPGIAQVDSFPDEGMDVPASITPTIGKGIYYVDVDAISPVYPATYTLSINPETTPAIQWPPPCTVPGVNHHRLLGRVKLRLDHAFCAPGRVTHAYNRTIARGHVVGLRPHAGAQLPYGTKVGIVVSRGPEPRHHHHRRDR